MSGRRINLMRKRRGIMLVIVLGLLTLVLAVSYAMTRSQFSTVSLQDNNRRTDYARQAAATGLAVALRKMHESGWTIDDVVTGGVSSSATYQATYATGDPRLSASDADYGQYPYRVTVTATGAATDPTNSAVSTQRKARAIVELIPRQMGTNPTAWQTAQQYVAYVYKNSNADIQFPARIEGKSFFQGNVRINNDYPTDNPRKTYLEGLNSLRKSGQPDYRPLNGPVYVPLSRIDSTNLSLLRTSMEVTVNDVASNTTAPVNHPGVLSSYKLYTGGKSYTVGTLPATISGATYQPDPITNPLGVYQRTGALQLGNNAVFRGVMLTNGGGSKVDLVGTGISIQPVTLPSLDGSSTKYQLPVLLATEDVVLNASSSATVRGMVLTWKKFQADKLNSGAGLDHTGRVIASELSLAGVSSWSSTNVNWNNDLTLYTWFFNNNGTNSLFPIFMQVLRNLDPKPVWTVKADASDVSYQWQDWSAPVFVPNASDPGLRWKLLLWNDPWEG